MKASMYFNYTSRSLLRGGQRTVLAVFCVAVGVMAIVALQLVGLMINNALTGDVRDANGGDISVTSNTRPFTPADLAFFNQLKQSGTITNYTTISTSNGSTSNVATITSGFAIMAVNPGSYPLVTPPTFIDPANGNIANLLTGNGVIVDKTLADQYNKKVGDALNIHVGQQNQAPRLLHVTIAGIVTDSGVLAQSSGVMLVSQDFYNSASPNAPVYYDTVYVTTSNQTHTDQAVKAINAQFPIANTQTVADALKSQQNSIDLVKKFLEDSGLAGPAHRWRWYCEHDAGLALAAQDRDCHAQDDRLPPLRPVPAFWPGSRAIGPGRWCGWRSSRDGRELPGTQSCPADVQH